MMRTKTTTLMECDRCGFKEECDDVHHQDQHWATVHAQLKEGAVFGKTHLCVACTNALKKWMAGGRAGP